ncbi:hypothetical protein YC2023_074302 [Brassica napus]
MGTCASNLCTHTQKYLDSLLVALIGLLLVDRYYEVETYTVMIIIQTGVALIIRQNHLNNNPSPHLVVCHASVLEN